MLIYMEITKEELEAIFRIRHYFIYGIGENNLYEFASIMKTYSTADMLAIVLPGMHFGYSETKLLQAIRREVDCDLETFIKLCQEIIPGCSFDKMPMFKCDDLFSAIYENEINYISHLPFMAKYLSKYGDIFSIIIDILSEEQHCFAQSLFITLLESDWKLIFRIKNLSIVYSNLIREAAIHNDFPIILIIACEHYKLFKHYLCDICVEFMLKHVIVIEHFITCNNIYFSYYGDDDADIQQTRYILHQQFAKIKLPDAIKFIIATYL